MPKMGLRSIWYSTPPVSLPVLAVTIHEKNKKTKPTANPRSFNQGTELFAIFAPTLFTPTLQHTARSAKAECNTHTAKLQTPETRARVLHAAKHSLMHVENHSCQNTWGQGLGSRSHTTAKSLPIKATTFVSSFVSWWVRSKADHKPAPGTALWTGSQVCTQMAPLCSRCDWSPQDS